MIVKNTHKGLNSSLQSRVQTSDSRYWTTPRRELLTNGSGCTLWIIHHDDMLLVLKPYNNILPLWIQTRGNMTILEGPISKAVAFAIIQVLLFFSVSRPCTGRSAHVKVRRNWTVQIERKLANVSDIQNCLSPAGVNVSVPGDSDFEAARGQVFNHRNFYTPAAIVFATSVAQVQIAVRCAVQLKVGISPRSGGHSYEDYSLGGRDGVLVVDLGGLTQFSYDNSTQTAIVGPGFRLGPLKLALWNAGKVTIPCGNCPSVGVGGHALGGGWGFVSRKFGLMTDNIVEAQVVIHNGSLVTANASQNYDLLRALKGAGANSFGIVTQFTFRVHDVSFPVTYFQYEFAGTDQFQAVKAFQIWGSTAPAEVSASLNQDPFGGNEFFGIYLGTVDNLQSQLQTFLDNVPTPNNNSYTVQTDYMSTVVITAGYGTSDPSVLKNLGSNGFDYPEDVFKAKSILVNGSGFSDDGITAYVNALQGAVQSSPQSSFCLYDLFGGANSAVNSLPVDTGDGFVHRDSLFNIQMFASWQNQLSAAANATNFVEGIWSAVRPYSSSQAYQNYIDIEEPLSAYYANNLNSLIATKVKWDSSNVFNFNQSIPLS